MTEVHSDRSLCQRIRERIAFLETRPDWLQAHWCVPPAHGKLLHLLIRSASVRNVLEVGTSIGYSTLWMALALVENNRAGWIDTIDASEKRQALAAENLALAGLGEPGAEGSRVRLLLGDARTQLATLSANTYDLMFLDAQKAQYIHFLAEAERLLVAGGLLVADNTVSHGDKMRDFLETIEQSATWDVCHLETPGGILLARKRQS